MLVVDTGIFVAVADRDEPHHPASVEALRGRSDLARYADLGLGFVDASIIAIAERLDLTAIATYNHRDFSVVRPTHCDAFELVP